MTEVHLTDSDKKKKYKFFIVMCVCKTISPVYRNVIGRGRKRRKLNPPSLSLYIYIIYIIGIELIVGMGALGALCTFIATFLISERDDSFKTMLINLIILVHVYQISNL